MNRLKPTTYLNENWLPQTMKPTLWKTKERIPSSPMCLSPTPSVKQTKTTSWKKTWIQPKYSPLTTNEKQTMFSQKRWMQWLTGHPPSMLKKKIHYQICPKRLNL
ncbi:MAG: hypothetical protein LKI94_00245 [Sporolactobacillus sp.]|nr:hypothetical protein [Sporolactobacillus sp.]